MRECWPTVARSSDGSRESPQLDILMQNVCFQILATNYQVKYFKEQTKKFMSLAQVTETFLRAVF